MKEHAALMETRKRTRKAVARPDGDSARRVLQKVKARAQARTMPAQTDATLAKLLEAHMQFIDTKPAYANRTAARDAQADRLTELWAALLGRRVPSHWQLYRLPPDSYPAPTWPYDAKATAIYFGSLNTQCNRNGSGAMLTRDPLEAGKWLLFDCQWKDDVPAHGKLIEYPRGDMFEGTFNDHFITGKGVCKYAEGDVYAGEFDNFDRHGRGKYTDANGVVVWDGEWRRQWPVRIDPESGNGNMAVEVLEQIVDPDAEESDGAE
jgi:hypothetical protein